MAWLTREEPRELSCMPNQPDLETLTYWVTRLEPLIRAKHMGEIIVVFANRTGIEGDAMYAGTSAVLGILNGEVSVYGLLGRGEKELLVVDTKSPPFGKLVYRTEHLRNYSASKDTEERTDAGHTASGYDSLGTSDKKTGPTETSPDASSPEKQADDSEHIERARNTPNDDETTPVFTRGEYEVSKLSSVDQTLLNLESNTYSEMIEVKRKLRGYGSAIGSKPPAEATQREQLLEPISIPDFSLPSSPAAAEACVQDPLPITAVPGLHSPRTAIRPKLVIPQSPTRLPEQMYPEQPASAASGMSGHSNQSIRSNESEASIQTIRSNHRPPEDSTPYPHSGVPLSGYPQGKHFHGGFVTIGQEDNGLGPITPFDDLSPIAAVKWRWPQSANPYGCLDSAAAWALETPIEVDSRPLPWSGPRALSRPRSRSMRRMHSNNLEAARRPTPPAASGYRVPHTTGTEEVMKEWKRVHKTTEIQGENNDTVSGRPASPKSRNASRSRLHGRPGSAMGKPNFSAAAQHLEKIAKRISSVPRTKEKAEHSETESYFDTDSSESANNSPDKEVWEPAESQLGIEITPIAPTGNLFVTESQRKMMIATPVAVDYYRSASNPVTQYGTPQLPLRETATETHQNGMWGLNDAARSPSRGRQREPKPSQATHKASRERRVRSTSIDSTRNDLLHRHIRRPSTNGGSQRSRNRSRNTIHGNIQIPDGYTPDDFERVEEIACPNCPVHGERSRSANNSVRNVPEGYRISQSRSSRRRSTRQSMEAAYNLPPPEMASLGFQPAAVGRLQRDDWQAEQRLIPEPKFAPAPVQRPLHALQKMRRNFASSPIPRASTAPLPFNPPTPKAMAFVPRRDDLDSVDEDELSLSTTAKGKLVAKGKGYGRSMQLPAAA